MLPAQDEIGHAIGPMRQFQGAFGRPVDIDGLVFQQALDHPNRLAALFEDRLRRLPTEAGCPVVEILLADANRAIAAIAAAAAPANPIGLEHMGGNAVLAGQVIGDGKARISPADDGDVEVSISVHWFAVLDFRAGRRCPIRSDMGLAGAT